MGAGAGTAAPDDERVNPVIPEGAGAGRGTPGAGAIIGFGTPAITEGAGAGRGTPGAGAIIGFGTPAITEGAGAGRGVIIGAGAGTEKAGNEVHTVSAFLLGSGFTWIPADVAYAVTDRDPAIYTLLLPRASRCIKSIGVPLTT